MSVSTSIQITCDYAKCRRGQNGPRVVQWLQEEIQRGASAPPEAKEFVLFDLNGNKMAFCGPLHAALFFLPDGYEEPKQKKVAEFPDNGNFPEGETA